MEVKPYPFELVVIEWEDAVCDPIVCGDVATCMEEAITSTRFTVGFLACKTKEKVVVAFTYDPPYKHHKTRSLDATFTIPTKMVKRIHPVEVKVGKNGRRKRK